MSRYSDRMLEYLEAWEILRVCQRPVTLPGWLRDEQAAQVRHAAMPAPVRAFERLLALQVSLRCPPAN